VSQKQTGKENMSKWESPSLALITNTTVQKFGIRENRLEIN